MAKWTAAERHVIQTARTFREACARLPQRDREQVRAQWRYRRGSTRQRRTTPYAHTNPGGVAVAGRGPETPDERRVARILGHVREQARAAGVWVDVALLLAALRDTDWRGAEQAIRQALPVEGWTR
ncbi:hypothetical protein [Sulfobacillus harzensis]|uniref:Uncharacterized protein n=1 Tax=Sulfobacillus harzensis TaxID=2729629 RepID=A0A7Y0L5S1_9FIRM|nr:hypothetical protein [Sulfobacillus harzensis]NMP23804.1 hypothetical protein [Sulfobacillus harzensis]